MQMPTMGHQAFISLYLPEQRFVVQPDLSKEKGVHTTAMVLGSSRTSEVCVYDNLRMTLLLRADADHSAPSLEIPQEDG
jgi:hypothetical protein